MKFRLFGRTGSKVSEIAFGGGRSGGLLIYADKEKCLIAVQRALEIGVNWFDTAPQYGNGKSEERLGWVFDEIKVKPHVSTKVRVSFETSETIKSQVERSIAESLNRLRLNQVDLLQMHNFIMEKAEKRAVTPDQVLCKGGIADAMEHLRDQGLVKFIGLTALGNNLATIKVIESGRFDAAQIYYNLINPSAAWTEMPSGWSFYNATGIVNACRRQGMALMAIRIFAASYLATKKRTGRESILTTKTFAKTEAENVEKIFKKLGEKHGSRAQTAVRFVLTNQDFATAIVGLSEIAHLEEACEGAGMGLLPKEVLLTLNNIYADNFT
ncbi:MAG: aldo/keto reductase [Pseudomonadota bacterium]|nr:aldo/keto reductase [Pseudomonadota bacterium]